MLVCNYGPSGNFGGRPLYKQGDPGTQCPEGTEPTGMGLCAWKEKKASIFFTNKENMNTFSCVQDELFVFMIYPCIELRYD